MRRAGYLLVLRCLDVNRWRWVRHRARNEFDTDIGQFASTAGWEIAHVDTLRWQIGFGIYVPQKFRVAAVDYS